MPARHGADDRRGQREERAVERAGDDVRLLDERRVLVDEHRLGVVRAPGRAGRRVDALDHHAHALVAIDEHVPSAELLDVRLGALHVEGRGREEAVAARLAPAPHAGERHRHDLLAEQRDDPLDGPAERRVEVAPAHRLAERDRRAHARERPAEELHGGAPALDAPADDVPPRLLLGPGRLVDDRQRVEPLCRASLANASAAFVGLPSLNAALSGGPMTSSSRSSWRAATSRTTTASRRGVPSGCDLAVRQARVRELVGHDGRERRERGVDERRGELLGADLEEEWERGGHRGGTPLVRNAAGVERRIALSRARADTGSRGCRAAR